MFSRKLNCLILLCVFVFCLVGNAFAENSPFNRDTEVYYNASFKWDGIENTLTDAFKRFQQIEILGPEFVLLREKTGIDLEEDIFSWIGNRIQMGIIGEENSSVLHKTIKEHIKYARSRAELMKTVSRIRKLRNAVELYKHEKRKLPPGLKVLAPKYISKKMLKPIRGSHFSYKALPGGKFAIKSPKDKFKDLGVMGPNPSYHSLKGFTGDFPRIKRKFRLKNMLMVIDVRDSDKARSAFKNWEKLITKATKSKKAFKKQVWKKYIFRVSKKMCYTFYGQQVFIADSSHTLKLAITSMRRPDKNIYTNKVFKDFMKDNPDVKTAREMMFINLDKIQLNSKLLKISKNHPMAGIVNNFYYASYFLNAKKNSAVGDMLFVMKPDMKDSSILKRYFKTPAYNADLVENLPGDLPMVASYNLGEIWNFLSVIAKDSPKLAEGLKMAKGQFGMTLGMDLENDLLKSTTGELGLSYMARDIFLSGIIEGLRSFKKKRKSHHKKRMMEPNNMNPGKILKKFLRIKRFPITFFVGVKNRKKLSKFMDTLKTKGNFKQSYYKDVSIFRSSKLTYCFTEDMLIIHTFPSDIKVKQFIDKLVVKRVRLSETTKYREFKKGVRGRVLLMQYQDSAWASYIAKGFMLLMLPEFKDYADKIGDYNESWSSLSITPRGIQLHFQVFKKEK